MTTRNQLVGISLIISTVFTISTFFLLTPDGDLTKLGLLLDILSYAFLIPGFFVLYALYKSAFPSLSITAMIIGITGTLIYAIANPFFDNLKIASGLIGVIGLVIPIMLFGICAYRMPQFGMPRTLGIVGILTGIFGIINLLAIFAGGGNWKSPNDNSFLASIIFISYSALIILSLVWSTWTGIILLSSKTKQA